MDEFIKKILEIPEETQTLEFKRLQGDKVVSKTVETIVSMANTDGGTIIFGVDDPEKTKLKGLARIFGIEENKELFDAIGREVQKIIPPIGNIWNPEVFEIKEIGKSIALLRINKGVQQFHAFNNHVYVRQLKSNKRLTPQEVVKFSYAKGFEKADKELVDVDFDLLKTDNFENWRKSRNIAQDTPPKILFNVGLARKNESGQLKPTRAAVLLFAQYPTNLMSTKCAIRVFQYSGTIEAFKDVPNLIGVPRTIDGPIIKQIKDAHEYVLTLLRSGIEIHSGFVTKYQIPERAIKEAITNAVIHRDYHIKRDIEISIFEDRVEVLSPGLFPYNITKSNIGYVRADGYRNDLLVKHLREFPEQPNLDRNEGVQAMRNEMRAQNLYDPIYFTYPIYEDSVKVLLLNEKRASEWEKVKDYLIKQRYITNSEAREVTGIVQLYKMSRLLKKWVNQGLLLKILPENGAPKFIKYKLSNTEDFNQKG
ncbi:MAG: RNA-binding domain-containing protein [Candidatus Gracilibacteria bacterium]|jgi:ATP-dependent DNA helicase RecG